jgi:hypothetical protein
MSIDERFTHLDKRLTRVETLIYVLLAATVPQIAAIA